MSEMSDEAFKAKLEDIADEYLMKMNPEEVYVILASHRALQAKLAAIQDTVGEENWSLRETIYQQQQRIAALERELDERRTLRRWEREGKLITQEGRDGR